MLDIDHDVVYNILTKWIIVVDIVQHETGDTDNCSDS